VLYTGVNNLYIFTKVQGFDPGASNGAPIGGGIDWFLSHCIYMLGLNINFLIQTK
jgi:hypothetical protein